VEETHTLRRPVLLAVDDDTDALAKIEHELRSRYGSGYRVVCETSAETGMRALEQCKANGEQVALVLADQASLFTELPRARVPGNPVSIRRAGAVRPRPLCLDLGRPRP
jgi:hypothetical protein